ncbi:MAG: M23 family metallopeptidase [Alphaproteobacteria bacterium]|nr:M23 family metallopeptidase [Alphaproteobacteria bacterium]
MLKLTASILLLTLFSAFSAQASAAQVFGNPVQGGLLYIRTDRPVVYGDRTLTPRDGFVMIGVSRDYGDELLFSIGGKPYRVEIAKQQWRVQRIDNLAQRMVTPPEHELPRIERERLAVRSAFSASTFPGLPKCFIKPVQGRVSGVFGSQRILNGQPRSPHNGIDIAAPKGTPVKAAAAGRVALVLDDAYFMGNTIVIDHGAGIFSIYAHLDRNDAAAGQKVEMGQAIGTVGMTGRATGPHLHFGTSFFSSYFNPLSAINYNICQMDGG